MANRELRKWNLEHLRKTVSQNSKIIITFAV